MTYAAPVNEMRFVINEIAELPKIAALPGYEEATPDLIDAILEEAAKFGEGVLAPLNRSGDVTGAKLENGVVRMPEGFTEAYKQFVDGGWNAIWAPEDAGGQGLPLLVATAVSEIWHAANMSFGLCPLLTQSGIELMLTHGTDELRAIYLEKLVSGEWSGTMNLTEPQAGSDLSRLRCEAKPNGDHYLLRGQKIYITYGEHKMSDNIVHMVLARTPDAPPGVKGISLFLVPKFLPNEDGSPGRRNDLRCVSIEHKLGINASPTCVMAYGDDEGAVGWLIGEENRGLEYMFTMMNNARLAVGMEGVGIAERAYQQAAAYAKERIQGRDPSSKTGDAVAIIEHPDVKRMLLAMKSGSEATRALNYMVAAALDTANRHPDETERGKARAFVDLMTPVCKAWSTDTAVEVASIGVQIHGGMGFVEETGAAQHYRDARILPIYEGTNAIQANDLVNRKIAREGGAAVRDFMAGMRASLSKIESTDDADTSALAGALECSIADLEQATDWIVETFAANPEMVAAGAVHYLRLLGITTGAWLLAKSAVKASEAGSGLSSDEAAAKRVSARFFCEQYLPRTAALTATLKSGGGTIADVPSSLF